LNAIKDSEFPWMRDVTKNAPQQAIKNLGRAYSKYFAAIRMAQKDALPRRTVRKPTFKRKGRRDSFRADSGPERSRLNGVRTNGRRIKLPRIGWIRMREALRFEGRILSVTVSRQADRWYAAVAVEVAHIVPLRTDTSIAGCDLGITTFATIANDQECTKILAPRPLHRLVGRVRRLSKSLSRKVCGSRNRRKAKTKLARLHARISDIRTDALHKLTTRLVRSFRVVGIEDINVCGILRNRHVAFALSDLAFGEFRRQLTYKAMMRGSTVVVVDRWFPSSKICSVCSTKNAHLRFGAACWACAECKTEHDRDENAARNLFHAASSAVSACGAKGAGSASKPNETSRAEAGRFAKADRNGQEIVGSTSGLG